MSLADLSTRAEMITTILVLLGVLLGYLRWVRPRIRRAVRTTNAVVDTMIGREAIIDHANGRVISPAMPGMGVRLAAVEDALVTLAHQDKRIGSLEVRVDGLEAASVERTVARAESAQMWSAMEAAANAKPPEPPEVEP